MPVTQRVTKDEAIQAAMAAEIDMVDNPGVSRKVNLDVIGEANGRFLFRSRPGVIRGSGHKVRIPVRQQWWDDPSDDPASLTSKRMAKVYSQSWERENSEEREGGTKPNGWKETIQQAFEDNGGDTIRFLQTPPVYLPNGIEDSTKTEVYFTTNSEAIAAVLRQMAKDKVGYLGRGYIYEVDQSRHYKVGDVRYAMNPVGLQMASDAVVKTGAPIEIEEKVA